MTMHELQTMHEKSLEVWQKISRSLQHILKVKIETNETLKAIVFET